MFPYSNAGILGKGLSLGKGINWASLLDGTQKTLGVINQAIPLVYQVRPIINNAKTVFKIASAMTSKDNNSSSNDFNNNSTIEKSTDNSKNTSISYTANNNLPTFYI